MKKKFKSIMISILYLIIFVGGHSLVTSLFPIVFNNKIATPHIDINEFISIHSLPISILGNISVVLLCSPLIFKLFKKHHFFNKIKLSKCFLSATMGLSFSVIFILLTLSVHFENSLLIEKSKIYYSNLFPYLGEFLIVLSVLFIAPFTEELVFRGLILSELNKNLTCTTSIVVGGLLFGIIHFPAGGFILVFYASIMGIIMGYICLKSDSLFPAIIAHQFTNFPEFFAFFKHISKQNCYLILFFSFIMFLVSFFLFKSKHHSIK